MFFPRVVFKAGAEADCAAVIQLLYLCAAAQGQGWGGSGDDADSACAVFGCAAVFFFEGEQFSAGFVDFAVQHLPHDGVVVQRLGEAVGSGRGGGQQDGQNGGKGEKGGAGAFQAACALCVLLVLSVLRVHCAAPCRLRITVLSGRLFSCLASVCVSGCLLAAGAALLSP